MIKGFRCKETAKIFAAIRSKQFSFAVSKLALRKLEMLHAAESIDDLRIPRGNRLEALKGDRLGQFSIRINDQFRICFVWKNGHAYDVEIVDYH